jgi:chromosome segregation ATPase
VERRLKSTSKRLGELREELRVLDEQLTEMSSEADDLGLRALVAETPAASHEHREASAHVAVLRRHRERICASILEHEDKIDELLEKMSSGFPG